ncbi:uncharacterized protein TM35_000111180 [Trypanosoma theileri]|uniref:PH-like domain-containing protein n=1 Tax=Trypanosoma theileri TaxID=67003 RepID=A0A1X0NY32_9TRYP|nr:uncharacterized protein TM35_000111180 [Trypanosoma theileri]ORC89584.1 hypothetical protein TM35_000111180 [Trypanosoma theileri]
MKSRQPKRNRINMHDIIAQPLGALPGAVDAILRRPEELDNVEVQSIFQQASFIMLRAEEGIAVRDAEAFCALFKLFSEGFARSEASFEKGVETFGMNQTLLQTLHGIFRAAVDQRAFPLQSHAIVELLQVVGSLCDGNSTKDACGLLFMEDLATMLNDMYLRNVEEARSNFLTQRAVATALINLVKGSKQNKQRILSWKFLEECCALSVDVFFQLQCVELLFRLSRHNKSLLADLGNRLRPRILDSIRHLPNDATLLNKMIEILKDINEDRKDVLSFPLNRVDVAHTTISGPTVSYFNLHYLVILVTSSNADNVTIPYRSIRSVTLGKDGRVVFRLDEFPTKIEALMNRGTNEDVIVLFMDPEKLNMFKESSIRSWIIAALEAKKERKRVAAPENVPREVQLAQPSENIEENAKPKRHRSESMQLTGSEANVVNAFQYVLKTSDAKTDDLLEKMKELVNSKRETKQREVTAILNASLNEIQQIVDEGQVVTDASRDALKECVEGNIQNIEQRLQTSLSKVSVVVDKLNHALQELKGSNTAIHEQMACIEITLQQSLEISREEEATACKALKAEGEENIGRLEVMLDRSLMGHSNPMSVISEFLQASSSRSVF